MFRVGSAAAVRAVDINGRKTVLENVYRAERHPPRRAARDTVTKWVIHSMSGLVTTLELLRQEV